MLRKNFFSLEEVAAIVDDFHTAGLEPAEVAMMGYARKLALQAHAITQADVDGLRAHGYSAEEITQIALVAAARSFFSKTLDALGAQPDEGDLRFESELLAILGRRQLYR